MPLRYGDRRNALVRELLLLTALDQPKRKRVAGDDCSNPTDVANDVMSRNGNGRDSPADLLFRSLRLDTRADA